MEYNPELTGISQTMNTFHKTEGGAKSFLNYKHYLVHKGVTLILI